MISYKGGDGSTKQNAIVILGVKDEADGVDAEYNYLEDKYGKYELVSQELIDEGDKQYDVLRVELLGGSRKEVWFNITEFYGRE